MAKRCQIEQSAEQLASHGRRLALLLFTKKSGFESLTTEMDMELKEKFISRGARRRGNVPVSSFPLFVSLNIFIVTVL